MRTERKNENEWYTKKVKTPKGACERVQIAMYLRKIRANGDKVANISSIINSTGIHLASFLVDRLPKKTNVENKSTFPVEDRNIGKTKFASYLIKIL